MKINEEVLSLDIDEGDFLYRIRRDSRIAYVSVLHGDIIPQDHRNESFGILSNLRKVPRWNEHWTTLTVRKSSEGIESTVDEFAPHCLDTEAPGIQHASYFNLLHLQRVDRISHRVSRVRFDGDRIAVLKIAPFQFEVSSLQREISIYAKLMSSGFAFAPKFLGYVYEEVEDRTIGFLIEDIAGRTPGIKDLEACEKAVRLLHEQGRHRPWRSE